MKQSADYFEYSKQFDALLLLQPEIIRELIHMNDGPVTRFVIISRACEMAANHDYSAEQIANALDNALTQFDSLYKN